jgi:hypothetical protein
MFVTPLIAEACKNDVVMAPNNVMMNQANVHTIMSPMLHSMDQKIDGHFDVYLLRLLQIESTANRCLRLLIITYEDTMVPSKEVPLLTNRDSSKNVQNNKKNQFICLGCMETKILKPV